MRETGVAAPCFRLRVFFFVFCWSWNDLQQHGDADLSILRLEQITVTPPEWCVALWLKLYNKTEKTVRNKNNKR